MSQAKRVQTLQAQVRQLNKRVVPATIIGVDEPTYGDIEGAWSLKFREPSNIPNDSYTQLLKDDKITNLIYNVPEIGSGISNLFQETKGEQIIAEGELAPGLVNPFTYDFTHLTGEWLYFDLYFEGFGNSTADRDNVFRINGDAAGNYSYTRRWFDTSEETINWAANSTAYRVRVANGQFARHSFYWRWFFPRGFPTRGKSAIFEHVGVANDSNLLVERGAVGWKKGGDIDSIQFGDISLSIEWDRFHYLITGVQL